MLLHLSVSNYALIDAISFDFEGGFTTITGETGAGKSIIMGALGLLLGKRIEAKNVDDKKSVVEGHFNLKKYNLRHFFEENDIDFDPVTILRREISPTGKSRAFVNDTPVKLDVLKNLSSYLIDIHSQHQNLMLESNDFQLAVVDAFCQHQNLIEDYKKSFKEFQELKQQLKGLEEKKNALDAEVDYHKFVLNELDEANITEGEIEKIEEDLKQQENIEEIKTSLFKTNQILDGHENSVLPQLNQAIASLNKIEGINSRYDGFLERLKQTYEELKDLQPELEEDVDQLEFNPSEVDALTERLNLLSGFLHKYHLKNEKELIDFQETIRSKVGGSDLLVQEIEEVKTRLASKNSELNKLGKSISVNRSKAFPEIESLLAKLITSLGIKYGEIKIVKIPQDFPKKFGLESVSFLFRANKGTAYGEIREIASGGELARVMLSIKYIISSLTKLPTILFDEIDTGISGDIADKMAKMMVEMGKNMQVIAITHLPQIASKGKNQFLVFKGLENDKTTTSIKKLSHTERIEEIAKMLSGDHVSDAALENAKILLNAVN